LFELFHEFKRVMNFLPFGLKTQVHEVNKFETLTRLNVI
jgi:hypothetical protein